MMAALWADTLWQWHASHVTLLRHSRLLVKSCNGQFSFDSGLLLFLLDLKQYILQDHLSVIQSNLTLTIIMIAHSILNLNKQNKIYHNQQVVSMKFQFLLMITFLMLAAGQSLSQDKAIHFPTTEQEIFFRH